MSGFVQCAFLLSVILRFCTWLVSVVRLVTCVPFSRKWPTSPAPRREAGTGRRNVTCSRVSFLCLLNGVRSALKESLENQQRSNTGGGRPRADPCSPDPALQSLLNPRAAGCMGGSLRRSLTPASAGYTRGRLRLGVVVS